MIVQSPSDRSERFVMTMQQHTTLAGEFAAHFGNETFEPVAPRDEMLYMVSNHDAGWRELDNRVLRDPATGLPYHLVQTPFEKIVETSSASPDFNEAHDPYCGLVSSMHSWGLYNGRYGLSDKILLDDIAAERRDVVQSMLDGELERQEHLKASIAADPAAASWVEPHHLLQNYKQLQFFDTLALYFNCDPDSVRQPTTFEHVPRDQSHDSTITIDRIAPDTYALNPCPFDSGELTLEFYGRWIAPLDSDEALRNAFGKTDPEAQAITLVAKSR